jgi:lysyl-tRNA synthetase class 2
LSNDHDEPNYPYRFERTVTADDLQERYADLKAGDETGAEVRVAGRLMSIRRQGKAAFADLRDSGVSIQLFGQQNVLGEQALDRFERLHVGDIIGATGEVIRTRRGELSVRVADFTVLAPCLRPMPEKWHGVTDVEVRYRQRYLDLLLNEAPRSALAGRARANAAIRRHLEERRFIEVETPLLQPIASGAVARPFATHHNALDIELFLRVAPELFLKRLLIGGLDRVYELNRSFRNEGISPRHNPEFTMLEAYEAYVDFNDTMDLVESLTRAIAMEVVGKLQIEHGEETLDLEGPFRRITLFEAVREATGEDLLEAWTDGDVERLRGFARANDVRLEDRWDVGKVMLEIFEGTAEKTLRQPTFVTGFPIQVSPLAKDHRSIPGFTEHADLTIAGVELAPIYSELNDPEEQRRRFEQQAAVASAGDDEAAVPDADFLEALAYGMPPAGGFGFGVDRFIAILLGLPSLREVILFPTLRPEAR